MPEQFVALNYIEGMHDKFVVGGTYFNNRFPWRSWRLAIATTIIYIDEHDVVTYIRKRFREWGNFYRLEGQYTSEEHQDDLEYFSRPSFYRYMAKPIVYNNCMFKSESEDYVIGRIAKQHGKVHALRIREAEMWTGTKYPALEYFCSPMQMRDLASILTPKDRVTMNMAAIIKNKEVITCKNCLRKIT